MAVSASVPKWRRSFKAGDLVTTRTCADIYAARARDKIQVDFGVLGKLELNFVGSVA